MTKYIDKAAVVAEIERLKENVKNEDEWQSLCKILSYLDTLEVKEVDLEKEIELEYNPIDGLSFSDFSSIARHFYNLGRKA